MREQWRLTKELPDVPSPLFYKGVLYLAKNGGIVTALDPKTGDILKQTRLQGAFDKFFASPIGADGKIYLTSESGKIAVVSASRELNLLAVNDLGEGAMPRRPSLMPVCTSGRARQSTTFPQTD